MGTAIQYPETVHVPGGTEGGIVVNRTGGVVQLGQLVAFDVADVDSQGYTEEDFKEGRAGKVLGSVTTITADNDSSGPFGIVKSLYGGSGADLEKIEIVTLGPVYALCGTAAVPAAVLPGQILTARALEIYLTVVPLSGAIICGRLMSPGYTPAVQDVPELKLVHFNGFNLAIF